MPPPEPLASQSPTALPAASTPPSASSADESPACPPPAPPFADCFAVELTGAPPCETICQRKRSAAPQRCCEGPVDLVISSGTQELLRVPACTFVLPECAHVHGHGFMDAHPHVLEGSPPEIVVVEGGCEARAMMHGYVPPGVAAWTGCVHQRYHWDGQHLARTK